jgi:hypothetical protein
MDKIVSIKINGVPTNVIIIPEHWNNGQNGFENADIYLAMDVVREKRLATIAFTEDKTEWKIDSDLDRDAEVGIIDFIKSRSPLTAL